MTRFLLITIVLTGCLVAGKAALGDDEEEGGRTVFDKVYEVKTTEFEDQVIEEDNFTINNIMLNRVRNSYSEDKGVDQVHFAASIKGRAPKGQTVSVMLAGFDEKKSLLWIMRSNDSSYGKSVGCLHDEARVPQGTLKSTVTVWMRVFVVTNGN